MINEKCKSFLLDKCIPLFHPLVILFSLYSMMTHLSVGVYSMIKEKLILTMSFVAFTISDDNNYSPLITYHLTLYIMKH